MAIAHRAPGTSESLKRCVGRLRRRLELNLEALQQQVTPESIHKVRTAARRLRAVLSVFKRELSPALSRDYRRALKCVTRKLGRLRDADVAHQSVEKLCAERHGRRRDELKSLSSALESRRLRQALVLQAHLTGSPWLKAVATLRSDVNFILTNEQPMASVALTLRAHRRGRLLARLRKSERSPERLHRLRRKVKTLRYLSEEMRAIGIGRVREEEAAALVGLQDILGKLQDLEALRHALRRYAQHRGAAGELRVQAAARRKQLLRDFDERRAALLSVWGEKDRRRIAGANRRTRQMLPS